MQNKLYGFLIGAEVQVDIENKRLIRITSNAKDNNCTFCVVTLKYHAMELLAYLLEFATDREVSKDEVLYHIWDVNNVRSSSQRLWLVLNELKRELEFVGIPTDFIVSSRGRGYRVNYSEISPLFFANRE